MKANPIFSECDSDLNLHRWSFDKCGYARRRLSSKPTKVICAHHDVCMRAFGRRPDWSKREVCDHINRNKLDNRRENLRITSIKENANNRPIARIGKWSTRLKNGRFQCQVRLFGKSKYLGCFDSSELATSAGAEFLRLAGIDINEKEAV